MHLLRTIPAFLVLFSSHLLGAPAAQTVTTTTLLASMADLEQLARWPDPAFRTIQFSSYDRRSTTADAPGWFSNADGFGGEPIPGFLKVLRPPNGDQPGLYLVAEVRGPGAIVRGWSAGMNGVLKVYLDPPADPAGPNPGILIFEGPAYDFLARRSAHYFKDAGTELDADDAFIQQDADYLPIPFARGLRVTWEGKLDELHFYHLQVRLYPEGTAVRTFTPDRDLKEAGPQLRATIAALTKPETRLTGESSTLQATIEPGRNWTWEPESKGPGAIRELRLRLEADPLDEALRRCLLRIFFDGSQRPQVEAPVGDFFASGPGVNPYSSLPFDVRPDGTMTSRFVMPHEKSLRIEIANFTGKTVRLTGSVRRSPWTWDERSLHFRAKWRADHDLLAGAGAIDLPYTVTVGKGVFAGCAAILMNPAGAPMAHGNWWGEGDEKLLVDGELVPSTFGTGSEDYFNYSWSRPDLFDHPYCGQPLDSGPDTSGYVSNHRFQVLDAIPFEKSLGAYLELWSHTRTPGLSYARIVYGYVRPGALDDHRALMGSDLKIPPLPKREPIAVGGAASARFHFFSRITPLGDNEPGRLSPSATKGELSTKPFPLATQLEIVEWRAEKGERMTFRLPVEKPGRVSLHLVAVHRPDGAAVRILVDGKLLPIEGGAEEVALRSIHAPRVLNVHCQPIELAAGEHEIALECVQPGPVGLDYIWTKGP